MASNRFYMPEFPEKGKYPLYRYRIPMNPGIGQYQECNEPPSVIDYKNPYFSTGVKKLYLNAENADVYFICADDKDVRIPAHKLLLGAANDAFHAMFYGELCEKGDIEINDASGDAFKEFLQFFYLENIKLTMDNIDGVLNLCSKYVFSSSVNICERFLIDSLDNGNVCFIYGLAILFDLNDLAGKCEIVIMQNTKTVLHGAAFMECNKNVLNHILKLETTPCIKIDVFQSCIVWVKAVSKEEELTRELIDKHLDDLFTNICFKSMTNEQLRHLLQTYGDLFLTNEYHDVVDLIVSTQHEWDENNVIECGQKLVFNWQNFQETEKTEFVVMESILLGEITFKSVLSNEKIPPMELFIFKKSTQNSHIVLHQLFEVKKIMQQFTISLQKKLILKPNFTYEVQVKLDHTFLSDGRYYCDTMQGFHRRYQYNHEPDIIKFHDNYSEHKSNFISSLNFNIISNKGRRYSF